MYSFCVVTRRIGISEARRLLPALVKTIARDGGRIDITYRGEPRVSLLRISDIKGAKTARLKPRDLPAELRVQLSIPADDLADAIRELRGRQGRPRTDWLAASVARPHRSKVARPHRGRQ
jgi:hypothetical protein